MVLGVFWNVARRACDIWAWYVGVRGVFWNVASVLVIFGRGGCGMWSGLECSWRACDAWAWCVGVL